MKKVIAALMCLLLFMAGCSAPKEGDLPEVLLTADGAALLSRTDLLFARAYEGISPKDKKDGEELFLRLSAEALCTRLSETWGSGQSYEEIAAEYEIYLASLETNGQQAMFDDLRSELINLSDEEFHKAFTDYLYRSACTASLLDEIAEVYGNTTDPLTIREGILGTLWELSESMEIRAYYPDIDFSRFDFEDVL